MDYVVLGFSILISIACFWMSFKMIRLYMKVKSWSRVMAKVESKEIFIHPKCSNIRAPYGLRVIYTYNYQAQNFAGHHVYLAELVGGQVDFMKQTAENKLTQIEPVMYVHVNQQQPSESVMYCSGIGLYVFVMIMGFSALLVGLGYVLA